MAADHRLGARLAAESRERASPIASNVRQYSRFPIGSSEMLFFRDALLNREAV
jgi:hypothetical protein